MEVTFLTEEQIWGDDQGNGQLQVMKDYGTKCGMSDLAVLLGGRISKSQTIDGQQSGDVWTASLGDNSYLRSVLSNGEKGNSNSRERFIAARPVLPASDAFSINLSKINFTPSIGDVRVVEYGEYPQNIAPENVSILLEQGFSIGRLPKTGQTYTFNGEKSKAYDKPFSAKEHIVYQFNAKRYIRVEAQPYGYNVDSVLSNGHQPKKGEPCWIEVQPIEWLKDISGVMVARQALFAGVQYDKKKRYDGDFAETDMKHYLDTYFAKEIMVSRGLSIPDGFINANTAILSKERAAQRQCALDVPTQGL